MTGDGQIRNINRILQALELLRTKTEIEAC